MRLLLVVLAAVLIASQAAIPPSGYIAEHLPDANPSVTDQLVSLIPALPHCAIRPQTISEIMAMRADSHKIVQSIEAESQNCDARRKYIADLTNFLNVWILELNRLKRDLNSCDKYIKLSTERVDQLALKEKLIKIEDVIGCLNSDNQDSEGWKKMREEQKADLDAQQKALTTELDEMKKHMADIVADKKAEAEG